MFTQLYGLQATPFTRALSTGDILATASVKELQARLALTVRERGIALVTGDVGSGKSTAVRAFLASLDPNRHTLVHLIMPMASPSALYRQMLTALNQPVPFGATAQTSALRAVLADLIQTHHKTPVVVTLAPRAGRVRVNEAHLVNHALIDPLTHSDLGPTRQPVAGCTHPNWATRTPADAPALHHAAFAQRITHRCHVEPLPLEATLAYIQHHLKVAGLKEGTPLFSDDALKRIAEWAQGIPRRINQICTAALVAGAVAKAKVIDDTPVRQAINDLERESLPAGLHNTKRAQPSDGCAHCFCGETNSPTPPFISAVHLHFARTLTVGGGKTLVRVIVHQLCGMARALRSLR